MIDTTGLPGAERVLRGLAALARRERTIDSLLVSTATYYLTELGFEVAEPWPDPELGLYGELEHLPDAHYQYNALRRRFDSFLATASQRLRRDQAAADAAKT